MTCVDRSFRGYDSRLTALKPSRAADAAKRNRASQRGSLIGRSGESRSVAVELRPSDVALPDGPPGHFEHPFKRHARPGHDIGRQLDPRLEVAQRDVQLLEGV